MVTNFVSEKAKIGKNVKIWHFAYVGDNTILGDNVKVGSLAHIDYDVIIGDNTMIEGMVYIPPMSRIGRNVFLGPAAVLTNDPYPPQPEDGRSHHKGRGSHRLKGGDKGRSHHRAE